MIKNLRILPRIIPKILGFRLWIKGLKILTKKSYVIQSGDIQGLFIIRLKLWAAETERLFVRSIAIINI